MKGISNNVSVLTAIAVSLLAASAVLTSCRHDDPILPPEQEQKGDTVHTEIIGFYLLNEGNMGSNKATLDFYDYTTAVYSRNIYSSVNPDVTKDLGDVGNDLQIYGSRMYAVINCSNKVEVMDAKTCKRIGQVDIPNCRYIRFHGPYAYVTSYAGPVSLGADHAQIGYVARFDTATLQLIDRCLVGYQPDELAVVGNKLYVANSGGYMAPDYDSTVSVIDLNSFTEIKRITVAKNLWLARPDQYGHLWVSSRGDYYDLAAQLFCIDTNTDQVIDTLDVAASSIDIVGDSLYVCATEWDYENYEDKISYSIVDIQKREVVCRNFITDGTGQQIQKPYCIKVNPVTHDIYLTDAKNYVTPGMLHCYAPNGVLKWSVRTGDIPGKIAFVNK